MNNSGYKNDFIGKDLKVEFPQLDTAQKNDLPTHAGNVSGELAYPHFSVFLSKTRKFPFFTATNINGHLFREIPRKSIFPSGTDQWKVDDRAADSQWGEALYGAPHSDFDKGHMTKREDPQWGDSKEALDAAKATFHFSNCVPQVKELNREEWKKLEDYILKTESVPDKSLVNVFTGPVLKSDDPVFVAKVNGQEVIIPTLFWKVVYFTNDGKTLSKVGFLMGQENLLEKKKIVQKKRTMKILEAHLPEEKQHFMDFADAKTYQVNLTTIEKLTGLSFAEANEPYKDERLVQLVIKNVDLKANQIKEMNITNEKVQSLGYTYEGLKLK